MPPEAPAPIAAAPATQAAPATVSTPVTPSPQVSPGPRQVAKPTPAATQTIRKSYDTRDTRSARSAVVPAATAASAASKPAAEAQAAAPVTPAASEAAAPAADSGAVALPGTETAEAGTEAAVDEGAASAEGEGEAALPEALQSAEMVRRLTHLAKAERKTAEGKRALAEERRAFAADQAKHAESLQRVEQMNNAQTIARKDPLGFMQRVFGVKPQEIIDTLIAAVNKKPEQVQQEKDSAAEQRIAALEKQLEDGAKQTKEQQTRAQAQAYVKETVAPIVNDTARFRFLNAEFGADAAATVYNTMAERFNRTGKAPPPLEVAEFIERELRSKAAKAAQLLSSGAATQQTANPKKVGTPTAPQKVPAQPAPAAMTRRPRMPGKPYVSQAR